MSSADATPRRPAPPGPSGCRCKGGSEPPSCGLSWQGRTCDPPKKEEPAPAPDQDVLAALAYWSERIRPGLGDVPPPGLRHLRDRYVLDVQDNPEALAQLREWWRGYGAAAAARSRGSAAGPER